MKFSLPTILLTALWSARAVAGDTVPATQPAKVQDGFRYLDHGSWVVTETRVTTNGNPATVRRKTTLVTLPGTAQRAAQEARWSGSAFETDGDPQPLPAPDRRTFDQLALKPHATLPDQVVEVARKRYTCSVTQYRFTADNDRVTLLTLWRDKSGNTRLPLRTLCLPGRELPLPADALQADFQTDGPTTSTHGERRIVSLASPIRVNNQTCPTLVESTRIQGTSNGKPVEISLREWFCHALPGERLRTVTAMSVGPNKVESDTAVTEFHVAQTTASHTRE